MTESCSSCGLNFGPIDFSLPLDAFVADMLRRRLHVQQHQDEIDESLRTRTVRLTARELRFRGLPELAEGLDDDQVVTVGPQWAGRLLDP
jgi:hypothetical protein